MLLFLEQSIEEYAKLLKEHLQPLTRAGKLNLFDRNIVRSLAGGSVPMYL